MTNDPLRHPPHQIRPSADWAGDVLVWRVGVVDMRNADRLVKKLEQLGYVVYGASFHILHFKYQEYMNTRAGECAPTWELRVEPLWAYNRVIQNGKVPTFDMPDKTRCTTDIYSFYPLTHILKTPIDQWEVGLDDAWNERLLITTRKLPDTWR